MLTCPSIYAVCAFLFLKPLSVDLFSTDGTKNVETELCCKQNSIRTGVMSEPLASVTKTFLSDIGSVTFFCTVEISWLFWTANPKLESRRRKIVPVKCHSSPITRTLQFLYRSGQDSLPISPIMPPTSRIGNWNFVSSRFHVMNAFPSDGKWNSGERNPELFSLMWINLIIKLIIWIKNKREFKEIELSRWDIWRSQREEREREREPCSAKDILDRARVSIVALCVTLRKYPEGWHST